MASFSSGYKSEYVALVNKVETLIKEIAIEDINNRTPIEVTRKKFEDLILDFAKEIPDDYIEKNNMIAAIRYSYKKIYNDFYIATYNSYEQAKKEIEEKLKVKVDTPNELISMLLANISKLNIKDVYDANEGSNYIFPRGVPYIKDYYTKLRIAVNSMVDSPIHEPMLKKGSLTLRSIMEMSIRQEFHMEQMQDMQSRNVNLVWVSSHADCSERCEKWQGRLYSLDHTSGTIDGMSYIPIETATDIFVTSKNGRVWKNGLFGFNCRHRMTEYVKGSQPPMDFTKKEIQEDRDINNRQRALERMIYKTRLKGVLWQGINPKKSTFYRNKGTELFETYKEFSISNNRAFYPERCIVTEKVRKLYRGKII